jgi:hypothetical protein
MKILNTKELADEILEILFSFNYMLFFSYSVSLPLQLARVIDENIFWCALFY